MSALPRESALPSGYLLDGRYEIIKELGRGGFGITYLATDQRTKQQVAKGVFLE